MTDSSNTALLEAETAPDIIEQHPAAHSPFRISPVSFLLSICCFALLAAIAWPIFLGRVYVADDLGAFHLPWRAFYAQQLSAGEPFDWCPDLFGGFYLTGEGQVGMYHPLHWLLYRTLPLNLAFDLECWLSYPLMLLGMFAFLRRWQFRSSAALLGAMLFTFSGFNLLHFVHPNAIAVVAHIPWLLFAIDVLLRGDNRRSRAFAFAAIALLTGSQLLLGYPQYVMFSLMAEACYVLFLTINQHNSWRAQSGNWVRWLAAMAVGCLLGAVQLLPTFDALSHSVRQSAAADFAAEGSLHPLNLIQLIEPYLFATRVVGQNTHELGLYAGAVPLVLAAWWLLAGVTRKRHKRLATFAVATIVFTLAWALGAFGPFGWLQSDLPLLNRIRFPSRVIVLFQFALAILAALGFAELLRQTTQNRTTQIPPAAKKLWWLAGASALLALLSPLLWPGHIVAWPLIAAGPALITLTVLLVTRAAAGSRAALSLLVILAAVDLGTYGFSYSIAGHTESLMAYTNQIAVPPGPPTRVALDLIDGNSQAGSSPHVGDQIMFAGWKRIDGYAGLPPERRLDYHQLAALRAAEVQWLAADIASSVQPADKIRADAKDSAPVWLPVPNSQPRAWLVTNAKLSESPASEIANIDLTREALLDQPLTSPLSSGTPGTVKWIADRPGRIAVETDCPAPQLLVVAESHHPGWTAKIDAQNAPVLRVNGDFLGLEVPAGQHKIALEFSPKSLAQGRLASGFGLGLIGAMLVWAFVPGLVFHRRNGNRNSHSIRNDHSVHAAIAPAGFRRAD